MNRYKCPECLISSEAYEWNKVTEMIMGEEITPIDGEEKDVCIFYCPQCKKEVDGSVIVEKTDRVEVITCESGDWDVLKLNEETIAEGHSLSIHDWFTVLDKLDVLIGQRCISDKDMESGNY